MEFLLVNHPLDCPICDQAGECDLQVSEGIIIATVDVEIICNVEIFAIIMGYP